MGILRISPVSICFHAILQKHPELCSSSWLTRPLQKNVLPCNATPFCIKDDLPINYLQNLETYDFGNNVLPKWHGSVCFFLINGIFWVYPQDDKPKPPYYYSDPEVDRIFFWRVRDLCWNYVGCRPLKKKQVVGIFRRPPGEVENW